MTNEHEAVARDAKAERLADAFERRMITHIPKATKADYADFARLAEPEVWRLLAGDIRTGFPSKATIALVVAKLERRAGVQHRMPKDPWDGLPT